MFYTFKSPYLLLFQLFLHFRNRLYFCFLPPHEGCGFGSRSRRSSIMRIRGRSGSVNGEICFRLCCFLSRSRPRGEQQHLHEWTALSWAAAAVSIRDSQQWQQPPFPRRLLCQLWTASTAIWRHSQQQQQFEQPQQQPAREEWRRLQLWRYGEIRQPAGSASINIHGRQSDPNVVVVWRPPSTTGSFAAIIGGAKPASRDPTAATATAAAYE